MTGADSPQRVTAVPIGAQNRRELWLGRSALKLHGTLVAGVALCAAASWFELTRALRGREVAWVYVFEWPLFAVMGGYVWWQLVHGEQPGRRAIRAPSKQPGDGGREDGPNAVDDAPHHTDPALVAWEDYLARLHAADPPGGPPPR